MPESKVRKTAADKKKQAGKDERAETRAKQQRTTAAPGSRQWVLPAFITLGLLGVLWLVVYYITTAVGIHVPVMSAINQWNIAIGMGALAASFILATLWK